MSRALVSSPPQDTVSETANQRTGKVEESEFFHGLRTNGGERKRSGGGGEDGGAPFAHSWIGLVALELSVTTQELLSGCLWTFGLGEPPGQR